MVEDDVRDREEEIPGREEQPGQRVAGRLQPDAEDDRERRADADHVVEVVLHRAPGEGEVDGDQREAGGEEDRAGAELADGRLEQHGLIVHCRQRHAFVPVTDDDEIANRLRHLVRPVLLEEVAGALDQHRALAPGISSTNPCAYCGGSTASSAPQTTSVGFCQLAERVADAVHRRRVRVVGLGRDELGEGERTRLRLGRRERRRRTRRAPRRSSPCAVPASTSRPMSSAPPSSRTTARKRSHGLARRPAAADPGVEDDEPRDRAPGARRRRAARSGRPSRARRASAP